MTSSEDKSAVRTARMVRTAAFVLLLAIVSLSPWPFGSANPGGQFVLALGLFALIAIWVAHAVYSRRLAYQSDAVSICLLGLVIVTAIQPDRFRNPSRV